MFAAAGEARLRGVVGTVADLLDVPRDLERAVEAALGEKLQWVVMDTFEAAKAALELSRSLGRRAGDVPAARLAQRQSPRPTSARIPDVVGLAETLVASGHPRLVANLLGSGRRGARSRLRRSGCTPQNGHDSELRHRGRRSAEPTRRARRRTRDGRRRCSLLARKRAIRDLGAEILRLEAEVEEAQERGRRAEARVAALDDSQRAQALAREPPKRSG